MPRDLLKKVDQNFKTKWAGLLMKPSPAGKGDYFAAGKMVDEEIAHQKAIRSPKSTRPA